MGEEAGGSPDPRSPVPSRLETGVGEP
jgi:hypothetical protein